MNFNTNKTLNNGNTFRGAGAYESGEAIWWQCDNEALPNETAYVFEFVHTNTH
jgi:hypothetical protein